eukprot:COSAG05_NODE_1733_length_4178_cov_47.990684_1_plen_311_part_10
MGKSSSSLEIPHRWGGGDPTKGAKLTASKTETRGAHFLWSTLKPVIVEQDTVLYRFAVLAEGTLVRWEHTDRQRCLRLDSRKPQVRSAHMFGDLSFDALEDVAAELSPKAKATLAEGDIAASLQSVNGVIIVGNLLPVNIRRVVSAAGRVDFVVAWNHDSLLSKKWNLPVPSLRVMWVGGVHIDSSTDGGGGLFDGAGDPVVYSAVEEMEEMILEQRLLEFNCVPVLAKPEDLDAHHDFCRSTLFPLFNGVIDVYKKVVHSGDRKRQETNWEKYKKVNQIFSKKVMEIYQPSDLIWVHNYQLMLLPSYLIK